MLIRPNPLSHAVIGSAIEVHRALGPGLFESVYQRCVGHELALRGIPFAAQVPVPLVYKGAALDCTFRVDFIVGDVLLVELKSIERFLPVHDAQLLTYLKLLGLPEGLLLNFNVPVLKQGIRRILLGGKDQHVGT
jgi:GxxExxY protein